LEETVSVGEALVDFSTGKIQVGDSVHRIEPKVLDVLKVLVEADNQLVSRETLIDEVWGVGHGGDERLTRAISTLRKALNQADPSAKYIETLPKRGYRLTATIEIKVTTVETRDEHTRLDVSATHVDAIIKPDRTGFVHQHRRSLMILSTALFAMIMIGGVMFTSMNMSKPAETSEAVQSIIPNQSLAVLPFVSMTPREEDRFFADGLSEELLNTFAKADGLKLASRTSSFAYKNQDIDIRKIGQDLAVAYVLEGSIRRADDKIRVTAQLISTSDGYHLWSESYDRSLEDIFVVQTDIAHRVAEALNTRLIKRDDKLLFDVGTQSARAFEYYVQGRNYLTRRGRWMVRAQSAFEAAIETDQDFAEAYSGLAVVNVLSPIYQNVPKEIAWLRAKDNADKALRLDPTLSEPYAVYGNIEASKLDWAAALDLYETGEANNPDDTAILQWQAELLSFLGYLAKASSKMKRAVDVDPESAVLQVVAGNIEEARGDLDGAAKYYRELESRGTNPVGLAMLEAQLGNPDKAALVLAKLNFIRKFITEEDVEPMAKLLSQVIQGEKTVDQLINIFPTLGKNEDSLTTFHLFAKNSETVLKRIEAEATEDYDSFFLIWTNVDPNLRQHPYFPTFVKNTGLLDFWLRNGLPDRCISSNEDQLQCR